MRFQQWVIGVAGLAGISFLSVSFPSAAAGPDRIPAANPPALVAYFMSPSRVACPAGWTEAQYGRGRLILATVQPSRVGLLWGAPFTSPEPVRHWHSTLAGLVVSGKTELRLQYNDSGPRAILSRGTLAPQNSDAQSLGLPYYQMALCESADPQASLDSLPFGSVAFFRGGGCPVRPRGQEWELYHAADGRFPMPLVAAGSQEKTVNGPWKAGPGPIHRHANQVTDQDAFDVGGDGNECLWPFCFYTTIFQSRTGKLKVRSLSHDSDKEKEPIPYVELLACRKIGNRRSTLPLPPLMTYFRAADGCPAEYRVPGSAGRFLVGLPAGGVPNQAFGGEPLKDGEDRTHTHSVKYDVVSQNVNVGAGNKNRDVARDDGSHRVTLQPASPGFPYIQLSHCWDQIRPQNAR